MPGTASSALRPAWHLAPLAAALTALAAQAAAAAGPPASCQARSAERQTLLIELYTSEGCNSCPPADRWLSSLKGRPEVLAAAFHVDYWDRLGWVDRFGSPRHTERQARQQRSSGAGFSYTPQVLANGRDWRGAPTLPLLDKPAVVQVRAERVADAPVAVQVLARPGAPARLALWWALLEDGHASVVRAGENQGVTLHHDHVVRQYGELPARDVVGGSPVRWQIDAAVRKREGGPQARLLVVVTDAATGAPLQALQLGC